MVIDIIKDTINEHAHNRPKKQSRVRPNTHRNHKIFVMHNIVLLSVPLVHLLIYFFHILYAKYIKGGKKVCILFHYKNSLQLKY